MSHTSCQVHIFQRPIIISFLGGGGGPGGYGLRDMFEIILVPGRGTLVKPVCGTCCYVVGDVIACQ